MMTLPTMPGHSFSIPGLGDVPVGSVTAYAGTLDTSGAGGAQDHTSVLEASAWMLCDGRELACAQYPSCLLFWAMCTAARMGRSAFPTTGAASCAA